MRKRKAEAIADVSQAADGLLVACERYLGRRVPVNRPTARIVHDTLSEVATTPPDMAMQLGRLN